MRQFRPGWVRLSVDIPAAWQGALDDCAARYGRTRSAEVRQAVRDHLIATGCAIDTTLEARLYSPAPERGEGGT